MRLDTNRNLPMAIEFQAAPKGDTGESGDFLSGYFAFMDQIGVPQEAFLTFVLVIFFLLAAFFFRTDSFGSGRR